MKYYRCFNKKKKKKWTTFYHKTRKMKWRMEWNISEKKDFPNILQHAFFIHLPGCTWAWQRSPTWGAGLHTLRAAPYAQAGCNLEMLCLEDSFRINFSNSASLTRVLTVKDCYMGSCQPLSWYERNFKWKMRTCATFLFWSHLCGWAGN